jgi:hypothetical protein
MIIHGETLISEDVLEKEFVCNLSACSGACCVEGEFGAPLDEEEIAEIDRNLEAIKPYMTAQGRRKIARGIFAERDPDGDLVTKCIKGRDCVFAISENGIYKCAIEKAFEDGKSDFRKPISCHLYPIRISKVGEYEALNYSKWDICSDACKLGQKLKVPVYKFLRAPLIRKFGEEWYSELEGIGEALNADKA